MKQIDPIFPVSGTTCKVAVVGGVPGPDEYRLSKPFAERAGRLLTRILRDAGIDRDDCFLSYVIPFKPPPGDKDAFFFIKKGEAKTEKWNELCPYPAFGTAGFIRPDMVREVNLLKKRLEQLKPNVVIALGPLALWALTGQDKIGNYRGAIMESTLIPGLKVLPTYEPQAVIKNWDFLPIVVMDVRKAAKQSRFPEIRRKTRQIYIEPSLADMDAFYNDYIKPLRGSSTPLSYDIETVPDNITCVSFAPSDELSIMVPLMDTSKVNWNYWGTLEEECAAINWMAHILSDPSIPKLAQNGLYDMQWLLTLYGIKVRGDPQDTMLMAHALDPELPKGLGFLGSVYTDEPAWKNLVSFKKSQVTDKEYE